ncbi:PAS domain S-box protein [Halorubrum depositum]|uniref:PAS domain S-box protein n=1 Tax=Halorubrum depositum TaxID=2583992 RepID=UPI0016425E6A|nr:PAS domain S-box protein [Halorubrum depositum]
MTDAVFALDDRWRFTHLNDRAEEVLDAEEENLLGEAVWDEFPEARNTTFYREYRRAVEAQEPVSFEEYFEPLEAWFSVRAYPSESGLTVYFRDVTDEHDRRAELERERARLAVRERFDDVLTDVSKLGTNAPSLADFQSRLTDRFHRVDGIRAVRIDEVETGEPAADRQDGVGNLEFGPELPGGFVDAVDRRDVTRVSTAQTNAEWSDIAGDELVFVPLVTGSQFYGVATFSVEERLGSYACESLFGHVAETIGCAVENLFRREKWRSVAHTLEQVDAGAYVVDADDDIVWVNDSFAEYVGIDPVDIVGSDNELFVEHRLASVLADAEQFTRRLSGARSTSDDRPEDRTARVTESYDREERVLEHEAEPVEVGRFEGGTAHVFEDVTEEAAAERSLAETEWIRESLLESFPGMAYRCRDDSEWEMDFVAGTVESLTGYGAGEIQSTVSWGDTVVDPRDRRNAWESIRSQLEDGDTFEVNYRIARRDGTTRWVWERGRRVETRDGTRLAGFVSDVTEKRNTEDRLKWEEGRFQSLVEHVSGYAIFTVNREGRIESWNDGAEAITGYDADEATGRHLSSFAPADRDDSCLSESHLTEASLSGESYDEGWVQTSDGRPFWGRVVLRAITDEDGGDVYGFVAVIRDMTEQRERRRELEHQRDELVTLNRINAVVRDIDRALVQARSREEIRTAICERLADDERYELAWIGESDHARNVVTPIEWAGDETEYVDGLDVRIDGERGGGPVGRSLESGTISVVQRIADNPAFGPWREDALENGFESSASIPIEYGGVPYGVLCVYSGEAGAFDEREKRLLAELGEMVGYALNAVDRKQALVEESMTEISMELTESLSDFTDLTHGTDGRVTLTSSVETGDGAFRQYIRTDGIDPNDVAEVLEENERVRSVEVLSDHAANGSLAISTDTAPLMQTVAVYGGRVGEVVAEGDTVSIDARFPTETNIRSVIERFRELYPDLEVIAKRPVSPEDEAERLATLVADELTGRQAEVLETAYQAGYYEWPRDTDGTELSNQLNVSAATLSQHLRTAHDKVVGSIVKQRLE